MSIEGGGRVRRCPGYKNLSLRGGSNPSPPCGYVWDPSPPPRGEGALCPKCWHKPARTGKRIIMPDGSENKVPIEQVKLYDDKDKIIVHEQKMVTEKGQDFDEANWDAIVKKKKKEKMTWAKWGKK